MASSLDTKICRLGLCDLESPLQIPHFIDDSQRIVEHVEFDVLQEDFKNKAAINTFENAGPRKKICFDPGRTTAAIVTCGGLCPGLNNVIQTIIRQLWHGYGVKKIFGIPYGYEGLIPSFGHEWVRLDPEMVDDIHDQGGTILGTSRGQQDISAMADTLVARKIDLLFTIGGDGTLKGAQALADEIGRRGLKIAVAGIPKTIDNDISYVDRTFGFETAVEVATMAVKGAHAEAKSTRNGIGLVKVMGRDSGFIAAYTALASNEANYVFVPEIRFRLTGADGFLEHLRQRLERKKHAVILVAEGAGQEYFSAEKKKDASGNILHSDIGLFLRDEIKRHFKETDFHVNLKYIDPSYIIRSVPASADDAVFCIMLAQNAVHGAMAGKTGFMVGRWNNYFVNIPLGLATAERKKIEPAGYLWSIVKGATGQPDF